MKKVWFKFKFLIIISSYILLAAAFVFFLVRPLVNNIESLAYQIQSKNIDREIEKAQIAKLPELVKEWSDYESREGLLNVILGQNDQVSFIENIESNAQLSGNKIELKIDDSAKDASAKSKSNEILKELAYPDYFSIQISLEGDYTGLVKFIHLLENGKFFVNIVSISAVKNSVEDDNSGRSSIFDSARTVNNKTDNQANNDSIKTNINAIVYVKK